jgi:hypothetical protein
VFGYPEWNIGTFNINEVVDFKIAVFITEMAPADEMPAKSIKN